jgi:hypothetical protein
MIADPRSMRSRAKRALQRTSKDAVVVDGAVYFRREFRALGAKSRTPRRQSGAPLRSASSVESASSRDGPPREPDDEPPLTWRPRTGAERRWLAEKIDEATRDLRARQRWCASCEWWLLLDHFTNGSTKCRRCESSRVSEYKRRRKVAA